MKKLFLLFTAGIVSLSVGAQDNKSVSLVRVDRSDLKPMPLPESFLKASEARFNGSSTANKTTAGGSRIYNYVNYMLALDPSIAGNGSNPYLWFTPDIFGIYSDAAGNPELDTIDFASYGVVLHPQSEKFNDLYYFDDNYPYPSNPIAIKTEPYTLDSIRVFGYYGRNPERPTVIDTLRVAYIYGDGSPASNMPMAYFANANIATNFGHDTVKFYQIPYDTIGNTGTNVAGGPSVVIKDIYLDSGMQSTSTGLLYITVPANVSIPSGNVIGVTVSFKSGDTYTPYSDTAFAGSITPDRPFKYGLFRPSIYEQTAGGFPTYTPENYNSGGFKFLPISKTPTWEDSYIPSWAWLNADYPLEFPDIDFFVTCATCKNVQDYESVKDAAGTIGATVAYPIPANDQITVRVMMEQAAKVQVSLMNTVGQVIAAKDLGNVVKGMTTTRFNTSDLANGIYLYTVEANGQRQTGRFVISR